GLHVPFHSVPCEVGARDEANSLVAHGYFGVHFAACIGFTLIAPKVNSGSRKSRSHFANSVHGDATSMLVAGLEQHRNGNTTIDGVAQRAHDRRHVVGDEAGYEE